MKINGIASTSLGGMIRESAVNGEYIRIGQEISRRGTKHLVVLEDLHADEKATEARLAKFFKDGSCTFMLFCPARGVFFWCHSIARNGELDFSGKAPNGIAPESAAQLEASKKVASRIETQNAALQLEKRIAEGTVNTYEDAISFLGPDADVERVWTYVSDVGDAPIDIDLGKDTITLRGTSPFSGNLPSSATATTTVKFWGDEPQSKGDAKVKLSLTSEVFGNSEIAAMAGAKTFYALLRTPDDDVSLRLLMLARLCDVNVEVDLGREFVSSIKRFRLVIKSIRNEAHIRDCLRSVLGIFSRP